MSGMLAVMYGNNGFSRVLTMGDRSDMGWQFVPMLCSLFGFRMGMIVGCIQR